MESVSGACPPCFSSAFNTAFYITSNLVRGQDITVGGLATAAITGFVLPASAINAVRLAGSTTASITAGLTASQIAGVTAGGAVTGAFSGAVAGDLADRREGTGAYAGGGRSLGALDFGGFSSGGGGRSYEVIITDVH